MNVLSCFDGMSCGQIALERSGIPVNKYFASEIDKPAIVVTQINYPDTIQLGSIEFVTKEMINHKIDLIIGGSPCQGFSFAGKQLNFEDPRSKLFFEFVRLKKELKPKYFFLENVKMKKEYQDIISEYLGCEPIIINSASVSAQNRVRLYWTNIPNIDQPADKEIYLKDILEDGFADRMKSYCITSSVGRTTPREYFKKKQGGLVCLGNVHPSGNGMNGNVYDINGKSPTLTTNKGEGSKIGVKQINPSRESGGIQPYQQNRVYDIEGKGAALLAELGPRYKVGFIDGETLVYRKLLPIECERLQTVPDNYTNHVSNTQQYKMLGNGWTIDVIAHFFKNIQ